MRRRQVFVLAFDLMHLDGQDSSALSLERRWLLLKRILDDDTIFSEAFPDGATLSREFEATMKAEVPRTMPIHPVSLLWRSHALHRDVRARNEAALSHRHEFRHVMRARTHHSAQLAARGSCNRVSATPSKISVRVSASVPGIEVTSLLCETNRLDRIARSTKQRADQVRCHIDQCPPPASAWRTSFVSPWLAALILVLTPPFRAHVPLPSHICQALEQRVACDPCPSQQHARDPLCGCSAGGIVNDLFLVRSNCATA